LSWSSYVPLPDVPVEKASIRWTGWLVPPISGRFAFHLEVTGGARLFIDESAVIDSWTPGGHRTLTSGPIELEGGQARRLRLEYCQGEGPAEIRMGWQGSGETGSLARALDAARKADQVVLVLGLTPQLEGEQMMVEAEGFKGGDRTSVALPAPQRELLEKVAALRKPVTVVLTTGSAISLDPSKANALLVAWYYGQRGGDAVAETLVGEISPAGRLPVTFYAKDADLPPFEDYSMANRTYRYFKGEPLFAFGSGLSFTTFSYSNFSISARTAGEADALGARVEVRNTGKRDSDEVVQLYVRAVKPPVPMPRQWLVGFQRVTLKAGQSSTVEIPFRVAEFHRWDESAMKYVVDPGDYELAIGPASDRLLARSRITVR
jgi:beta-glucosidase